MNIYEAYFSADSLREFTYTAKYENLIELENFTLFYLFDEQKFEKKIGKRIPTYSSQI